MKRMGWMLLAVVLLLTEIPVTGLAVDLNLPGKSAVLMDIATGQVLFEAQAHEKLAPASVTKVMTMLLIMEAVDSGKISWEDQVTASETAAAKGGSQIYLKAGEVMTVTDMVKAIAVSSANDCACAMAEHLAGSEAAFVEQMNERAGELGMEDTHFVNCTGLDDSPEAKNHRTSAWDIAQMSRQLLKYHPTITQYTTIWMDTVRDGAFGLSNTNKLIRFYPGATGLKTGFTSGAGYCLSASAERDGLGLIAVVMGCDTSQERFAACKSMLDYGFANYALVQPEMTEKERVSVLLGKERYVSAIPATETELLVEKGQREKISTQVELESEVPAPVSQGQRLGTMTVSCGEQVRAQVPLVAETAVERLSWWDLFLQMLGQTAMAENRTDPS